MQRTLHNLSTQKSFWRLHFCYWKANECLTCGSLVLFPQGSIGSWAWNWREAVAVRSSLIKALCLCKQFCFPCNLEWIKFSFILIRRGIIHLFSLGNLLKKVFSLFLAFQRKFCLLVDLLILFYVYVILCLLELEVSNQHGDHTTKEGIKNK